MDISTIIAVSGATVAVGSLIIQIRRQFKDEKTTASELAEKREETAADQLSQAASLSISLIAPLQSQINVLSQRVSSLEDDVDRYETWIVQLVKIIVWLVEVANGDGHDLDIFKDVLSRVQGDQLLRKKIRDVLQTMDQDSPGPPGASLPK